VVSLGRLSVDTEEVIIRRTVGQKKDEFFLNRRRIQKNEIISLLESAGFSKSNPYYIVQQGKVSTLCVMKDSDRLGLLKEIAGTVVYEERKAESLKILLETTNKQSHIEEVLVFIDERLGDNSASFTAHYSFVGELEREKEELVVYDQLDRQRRALRYTLYSIELTKVETSLLPLF
jgi:structural maintenance of chromosome 3 (chondroitin sulfate proteoglycan 6)